MDIYEVLVNAPNNFTIQDALTKCNSMINNRKCQHILCELPRSKESAVIKDMLSKCDFAHKVDYIVNEGTVYDLLIDPRRLATDAYHKECAGNGLYRPVFWFNDYDLDEYLNYYNIIY